MEINYKLVCAIGFCHDNHSCLIKPHVFMKTSVVGCNMFDSIKIAWN